MSEKDWPGEDAVEMLAEKQCNRAASWGHHSYWWEENLHPTTKRSYRESAHDDLQALRPYLPGAQLSEILGSKARQEDIADEARTDAETVLNVLLTAFPAEGKP